MKLADMLSYSDIQQLSSIAKHYNCDCSTNSKRELIQSILLTIKRHDMKEEMIERSTIHDLRFLNSLLFEKRSFFSIEELIARAEMAKFADEPSSDDPREIIAKFKRRGWLFNGYSTQTKYLFQVPQDLKETFSTELEKHFASAIVRVTEPEFYRDEQSLLQEDLMTFLRFVQKDDIPLTADGYMHKRHLQQLLAQLIVPEQPVQKEAWRFGYGRRFKQYPNRFSFLYDYCMQQRYMMEDSGFLRLTPSGLERLEALLPPEDVGQMYRYWLKLYGRPIKNLASFTYWISKLAQDWIATSSLQQILCTYIKPYYYDTAPIIFEKRIVQMMVHLGLLAIGEDESEGQVIRLTSSGQHVIHHHTFGEKR